ncbi:MAG: heme NO-binding domain-containing protein [Pseudothermotoga sp.]
MKGFIVNAWFETWGRLFGVETIKKMKQKYNIDPEKIFSPIDDVADQIPIEISKELASMKGLSLDDLWYETGKENLNTFFGHYPEFFKKSGFLSFMAAMDAVHRVLTKRIKGATPPRVFFKLLSDKKALVKYQSRRNFKKYFLGLMDSASKFFNEPISYKIISEGTSDGQNYMEIEVQATKSYGTFQKLKTITGLSVGFIRSLIPFYSVMLPVYTFVITFLCFTFIPSSIFIKSLISALGVFALSISGMLDFKNGMKAMDGAIESVAKKDLDSPVSIDGMKEFSNLSYSLSNAVDKIKEVLLGISGDIQEINSYSDRVINAVNAMKEQLDTMGSLSNEIANTAVQISNDTERISNAVSSNVETITSAISEQTQIVNSLNEAVSLIVNSANNVEKSADGIVKMSERFARLVEEGKKLQDQASLIMEVASTVTSIAEQTNLLALNAAIEAARSGEAGRGFAVVADEIRKLAEESRSSAAKISEFLGSITSGIDALGKAIQSEFNEMKEQSKKLLDSSERNKESSGVISAISSKLNSLIQTLNNESAKLSSVTNSIQNLLAISEESSATAEEISSSIQNFFAQLKVVFDSVNETVRLLKVIQENFEGMKL